MLFIHNTVVIYIPSANYEKKPPIDTEWRLNISNADLELVYFIIPDFTIKVAFLHDKMLIQFFRCTTSARNA